MTPAKDSAAVNHQACRNTESVGTCPAPVPSTATRRATPRAIPIWRTMLITAEPVANDGGGSEADAVAIIVGSVSPTPMPVRIMPPSTPVA